MKKIISNILKYFAGRAIRRHRPVVIGITGSVGKTSAKTAIAHILSKQFNVSSGIKNYNNEIGYPLAILGIKSAGKNIFLWILILAKAFWVAYFKKDFPEILVLELGAAKRGDIDYLSQITNFDIAVITSIGHSHLEKFGSIKQTAKEKGSIIKHIKKNGRLIYNFDDKITREIAQTAKALKVSYGFQERADVQAVSGDALNLFFNEKGDFLESSFKIEKSGSFLPVRLNYAISKPQVYATLAAIAVSDAFDINLVEASENLKDLRFPPGRMSLLKGVKNTTIIDDTYNSSPESVISALDTLAEFGAMRRIAVLGDMLELGGYTEEGHREAGRKAAKTVDLLFLVGDKVAFTEEEAKKCGMKDNQIKRFATSDDAKKEIEFALQEGDLILIKGSQGMRMEKIVVEIMAEPNRASELVVRQGEEWK